MLNTPTRHNKDKNQTCFLQDQRSLTYFAVVSFFSCWHHILFKNNHKCCHADRSVSQCQLYPEETLKDSQTSCLMLWDGNTLDTNNRVTVRWLIPGALMPHKLSHTHLNCGQSSGSRSFCPRYRHSPGVLQLHLLLLCHTYKAFCSMCNMLTVMSEV